MKKQIFEILSMSSESMVNISAIVKSQIAEEISALVKEHQEPMIKALCKIMASIQCDIDYNDEIDANLLIEELGAVLEYLEQEL